MANYSPAPLGFDAITKFASESSIPLQPTHLRMYAVALGTVLLHEMRYSSYDAFSKKLSQSIRSILKAVEITKKRIPGAPVSYAILTQRFFTFYHRTKDPFDQQLRAFRLNLISLPRWLSTPPLESNGLIATPTYLPGEHVEPILGFEIKQNGELIGTVGGYFFYRNQKPTFCINHIQGANQALDPNQMSEGRSRKYDDINQKLGKNWRKFYVEKFVEELEKKGFPTIGIIPERFVIMTKSLGAIKEYKRQVRQYQQAYRQTGFKPLLGHQGDKPYVRKKPTAWIRRKTRQAK